MSDSPMLTEEYQQKVLSLMLHNPGFCDVAKEHLEVEHFNNKILQWYFTTLASSKHHLTPVTLQEELIKAAKGKSIKDDEVHKFVETYGVLKERIIPVEQEYIKDKIGSFIKAQSVKHAVMNSISDLSKQEKWDEIVDVMQKAVNAGFDLEDFGTDYFATIEERVAERATRKNTQKILIGIPEIDNLTYGGLKMGQVGLLVGGTGRGKTLCLQHIAKTAILNGKNVVYITLELREDDISDRFDSMFAEVRPNELDIYQQDVLEAVPKQNFYGKSLIVKHFPADSATVNTLKAYCRNLASRGIVPDEIIVDYIDLIKSHKNYGDVYAEIDAVTKALVGFASEFDVVLWTAAQMNRAGMVSESPDESGIAGGINKLFSVDFSMMIAQSKEERADQITNLKILKNRNGPIGTVTIGTEFSKMIFFDEKRKIKDDNDGMETKPDGTTLSNRTHNMQLLRDEIESQSSDSSE